MVRLDLGALGPVVLAGLLASTVAGCAETECDASSLRAELEAARAGDVVEVGACTVDGSFAVPAGVTLRGAGAGRSTLRGAGGVVVELGAAGDVAARLEDLTVVSEGCAGVVVRGDGEAALSRVSVEATRGLGIGAEGLAGLSLSDVQVTGPLAGGAVPSVVPLPPYDCASADPATHGLVVVDVGTATLRDVDSEGFAAFGALFVRSEVDWIGGQVSEHLGTGLEVYGGSARLEALTLCRARQGMAPIESFNGFFGGDAEISTSGLLVCEGEAFGLMQDGGRATHVGLVARDNGFAAVWAQNASVLSVTGAGTELLRNGFAGIAALDVGEVSVADATVGGTELRTVTSGMAGSVQAGDGVHLVRSPMVAARDLQLLDNQRVGLLLDLGGEASVGLSVTGVLAEGTGEQLGAVAQNGTVPDGWDEGVTRRGAPEVNDPAFSGRLPIGEAVGPSCLPDTSGLESAGLAGFL